MVNCGIIAQWVMTCNESMPVSVTCDNTDKSYRHKGDGKKQDSEECVQNASFYIAGKHSTKVYHMGGIPR